MRNNTSYIETCVVMCVADRGQRKEKTMVKKITRIDPVKQQITQKLQPKKRFAPIAA
jgi:hypothetical protein